MDLNITNIIINDVNGSQPNNGRVVTSGQEDRVLQADPDRQQTTVLHQRQSERGNEHKVLKNRDLLTVATWNVRTMYQIGKLDNIRHEMHRMKINIMGLSEVRWPGVGEVKSGSDHLIYSGGQKAEKGVGIIVDKRIAKCVQGFYAVSDRVLLVRINGQPFNLNIIQVYAPTADSNETDIDNFYQDMETAIQQCKNHEVTVVMGDLNAKVGRGRDGDVLGPFGLGEKNERGEKLIEWCMEHDRVIMNTWFRHHPRHLYTWKSPGDNARNQIDYITINARFRNAVIQTKTRPGADCNSDHVPVVAKLRIKLKCLKKPKLKPKLDLSILKNTEIKQQYQIIVKNKFEALCEAEPNWEDNTQSQWNILASAIHEANEQLIPKRKNKGKKPWMTEEILKMMDERRVWKDRDRNKYQELNRVIHRECNKAKEMWLNEQCKEIEELGKKDQGMMYEQIAKVTGKKTFLRSGAIKSKEGCVLTEKEEVKARWKEYVEDLYKDNGRRELEENLTEEIGTEILPSEIRLAMKNMKKGKAVGEDDIAIEMMEALEEFAIDILVKLTNKIYETGNITTEMCKSIFITMPKVAGTLECNKHRTLAIMSQITKIILRVIINRIRRNIRDEISREQFGFIKGKGTTNAIFALRMVAERLIEKQKNVYLCFIDYEKAFDMVKHDVLIEMLENIGIGGKELRLIKNLYWQQEATVKVGPEETDMFHIKRGVRQGCVMSPDFFNLYGEMIMREIKHLEGVNIGGYNVNNIRYADDSVLIADTVEKLQQLVNTVEEVSEQNGLKINVKKTEVLVISKSENVPRIRITSRNNIIKQVNNFKYLGSTITEDGRSTKEIKKRIGIAKTVFQRMKGMLTNNAIRIETKVKAIKTYVWSTLTYGCETWTISKALQKNLEAAEMWMWRRMLRISWTQKKTNEEVLHMAGLNREIMHSIRKRQMTFLGHIVREEGLEYDVLTGIVEGKRARGRQREKFMDGLTRTLRRHTTSSQLIQRTRDRQEWRSVVADVLRDLAPE